MQSKSISIRTEPDLIKDIDAVAKAQDRSRNWWINQALKSALMAEQSWMAQVERGLKAANAGDFISEPEMSTVFERYSK